MADQTWREIERRGLSGRGESGVPAMSKHGRLLRRDQVPWEVLAEWESGDDSAFFSRAGGCGDDLSKTLAMVAKVVRGREWVRSPRLVHVPTDST